MLSKEELAKQLQREYLRNWRSANKDKVRAYNRKQWEKKAEKTMKEGGGNDNNAISNNS